MCGSQNPNQIFVFQLSDKGVSFRDLLKLKKRANRRHLGNFPPLWASYDSVFPRNLELKTIFCFRLNNLNRKFDTLLAPSPTSFREIETREERAKLPEKDDALALKTFWQTMSSLHTSLTVMNVYCFLYIFSKHEFSGSNSFISSLFAVK